MTKKQLVLLAIMMLCPLLIMLGFFSVLSLEVQKNNELLLNSIDKRVSTIVIATLNKVKDDISVLYPSVSAKESPSKESEKSDKKEIKLEGDATLTTLDDSTFFVGGRLYELGDIIAPYGIVTAVGRDMIVFQGFDGQITVFGQTFEFKEELSNTAQPQIADQPKTTAPAS